MRLMAHTVVVEDLKTTTMARSAKGTVEESGRHVRQETGLNRIILASGWGSPERKLEYRAGTLVKVDPAHTSQTLHACSHTSQHNRPSQEVFACGAGEFRANTEHNAAINIPARAGLPPRARSARGTGAAAR